MRDLLHDWRVARDWRSKTGLGEDGQPGGGQLIKDAENKGDPGAADQAEISLESKY